MTTTPVRGGSAMEVRFSGCDMALRPRGNRVRLRVRLALQDGLQDFYGVSLQALQGFTIRHVVGLRPDGVHASNSRMASSLVHGGSAAGGPRGRRPCLR